MGITFVIIVSLIISFIAYVLYRLAANDKFNVGESDSSDNFMIVSSGLENSVSMPRGDSNLVPRDVTPVKSSMSQLEKVVLLIFVTATIFWVSSAFAAIYGFHYRAFGDWSFSPDCGYGSCFYKGIFATYFFVFFEAIVFSLICILGYLSKVGSQMWRLSVGFSAIFAILTVFTMHSMNRALIFNLIYVLLVVGGYWLFYWMFYPIIKMSHINRTRLLSRFKLVRLGRYFEA